MGDGAASVVPHYAAGVGAGPASSDAAGVVAIGDGAAIVVSHYAADVDVVPASSSGDVAGVGAVFNRTCIVPHYAADVGVAGDGAGDGEVLHCAADAHIAEEALVVTVGVVDMQPGDGVAAAVEGAGEGGAEGADGGPLAASAPAQVDVGGEEVAAA